MSDAQVATDILSLAVKLGVVIYEGIRGVIANERPELLSPPPSRADGQIHSEDATAITDRFPPPAPPHA